MSITAKEFLNSFSRAWHDWLAENSARIVDFYTHATSWTSAMLQEAGTLKGANGSGVLLRTFDRLSEQNAGIELKAEWYTIDRLIVSGTNLLPSEDKLLHPARLDVLIEHENGDDWEVEMWKLLFWRSPLKVLIGYDYNDDDVERYRKERDSKGDLLSKKIKLLRDMYNKSRHATETKDTEQYLLIVGNRADSKPGSPVRWRWCRIDEPRSVLTYLAQPADEY